MTEKRAASHTATTDETLMHLSSKGDRFAFECLYDRYFKKLVWFASGYTNNTEKAEDVVQEVFIKIIQKPGLFDQQKKFSTWVYTVTANHCKNAVRNEINRARIVQENVSADFTVELKSSYDVSILRERINGAVSGLSAKEQNIYALRFEEEMSIKEIAGITSLPEGSVKSGIFHLLKKIGKHLKDFTHENR